MKIYNINDKPKCKYSDQCKSFKRLENGDYNISDLCHIKLYRHPPRTRNIKLSENMNAMVLNKNRKMNVPLYIPHSKDTVSISKYRDNPPCYLASLIVEVIGNGFGYDLCLECGVNDECKHNNYSIMKIVDAYEKMNCKRHKIMDMPLNRADILAVVLYTGLLIFFFFFF